MQLLNVGMVEFAVFILPHARSFTSHNNLSPPREKCQAFPYRRKPSAVASATFPGMSRR